MSAFESFRHSFKKRKFSRERKLERNEEARRKGRIIKKKALHNKAMKFSLLSRAKGINL